MMQAVTVTVLVCVAVAMAVGVIQTKARSVRIVSSLAFIALAIVVLDLYNWHQLRKRRAAVCMALRPGMKVEEMEAFLAANGTRLGVASWRLDTNGNVQTLFVWFKGPLSVTALVSSGEGAWYLMGEIDTQSQTLIGALK